MKYGLAFILLMLTIPSCCLRKDTQKISHTRKSKKRMKHDELPMDDQAIEMETMEMENMDLMEDQMDQ